MPLTKTRPKPTEVQPTTDSSATRSCPPTSSVDKAPKTCPSSSPCTRRVRARTSRCQRSRTPSRLSYVFTSVQRTQPLSATATTASIETTGLSAATCCRWKSTLNECRSPITLALRCLLALPSPSLAHPLPNSRDLRLLNSRDLRLSSIQSLQLLPRRRRRHQQALRLLLRCRILLPLPPPRSEVMNRIHRVPIHHSSSTEMKNLMARQPCSHRQHRQRHQFRLVHQCHHHHHRRRRPHVCLAAMIEHTGLQTILERIACPVIVPSPPSIVVITVVCAVNSSARTAVARSSKPVFVAAAPHWPCLAHHPQCPRQPRWPQLPRLRASFNPAKQLLLLPRPLLLPLPLLLPPPKSPSVHSAFVPSVPSHDSINVRTAPSCSALPAVRSSSKRGSVNRAFFTLPCPTSLYCSTSLLAWKQRLHLRRRRHLRCPTVQKSMLPSAPNFKSPTSLSDSFVCSLYVAFCTLPPICLLFAIPIRTSASTSPGLLFHLPRPRRRCSFSARRLTQAISTPSGSRNSLCPSSNAARLSPSKSSVGIAVPTILSWALSRSISRDASLAGRATKCPCATQRPRSTWASSPSACRLDHPALDSSQSILRRPSTLAFPTFLFMHRATVFSCPTFEKLAAFLLHSTRALASGLVS